MHDLGAQKLDVKKVKDRILKCCKNKPGMADVPQIVEMAVEFNKCKFALAWEGNQLLTSTLDLGRIKEDAPILACFGDLKIDGDFFSRYHDDWQPMLFIDGTLTCNNIVKGGMFLVVGGDIDLTGYYAGDNNEGYLRVSGALTGAGFVPRLRDKLPTEDYIAGGVKTKSFSLVDCSDHQLKKYFVPEVIAGGWSAVNVDEIISFGRAGKSIWKERNHPESETKLTLPPLVEKPIDPTHLGTIGPLTKLKEELLSAITLALQASKSSNPVDCFSEFVNHELETHGQENALVLPGRTKLDGDLILESFAPWAGQNEIAAIVCLGDLEVTGDILNKTLEHGPMLFAKGSLTVNSLHKGGSTVIVLGDLLANELVIGEYNDGVLRIAGDLKAAALLSLDHDCYVAGETKATYLHSDDCFWRDHLSEHVFSDDAEDSPNAELLLRCFKAKVPILLNSENQD
jgi:hypothetical protein